MHQFPPCFFKFTESNFVLFCLLVLLDHVDDSAQLTRCENAAEVPEGHTLI